MGLLRFIIIFAFFKLQHSDNTLLIVLKLHDERLDVLALALPLCDALLSIRVEVFLLLVEKRLSLYSVDLFLLKLLNSFRLLSVILSLDEFCQFLGSLPFLLLLLLLCHLKLLVTDPPELSEVLVLLHLAGRLLLLSLDLEGPAPLNCCLHISLSLLLLLEEPVGSIFSFSDLSVQHLLFVVLKLPKVFNLTVNHFLSLVQFGLESLALSLFLHGFAIISLPCKFFNLLLFLSLLQKSSLLLFHLILIGFRQVSSHLGSAFLPLNFLLLFPLQILLNLPLDQFALKEFLLDLLDVA